jgi:cyclase
MVWTRRHFIGAAALAVLGNGLPRPLLACGRGEAFTSLRRGVGIFTASGGTIGWLVNGSGALVVDSQFPDTARDCLAGLQERSAAGVDVLINTHHHSDHVGGNGVFREVVHSIVAHERAAELQRSVASANPAAQAQTYPDTTFAREWVVEVGDERIRARHYGAAHTGGDCTVFFERANVVHLGDLVFNRAYPFVDRSGGASMAGWISLLESVTAEHDADTLYIFGHGKAELGFTGSRADVLLQRDLLQAALDTAQRAHAAGSSREEVTAEEHLPGFPDHSPLASWLTLGHVLGAAWDELNEGR